VPNLRFKNLINYFGIVLLLGLYPTHETFEKKNSYFEYSKYESIKSQAPFYIIGN
jgi:hypothetical protein